MSKHERKESGSTGAEIVRVRDAALSESSSMAGDGATRDAALNVLGESGIGPETNRFASLRTLFDPSGYEAPMNGAVNYLCDVLQEDRQVADLWTQAIGRANWFEGEMKDPFIGVTHDDIKLENLMGGRPNLEVWVRSSQASLKELLTHEGSTFKHLGNAESVKDLINRAKSEKSPVPLLELARHIRSAIHAKSFYKASHKILQERLKRLAAKYALSSSNEINPQHRIGAPYYASITLEQLKAYLAGDRSDYVFGIEKQDHEVVTPKAALNSKNEGTTAQLPAMKKQLGGR